MSRKRLILDDKELKALGFVERGEGDDPGGYWHEIELSGKDSDGDSLTLQCDALLCPVDLFRYFIRIIYKGV